MPHRKSPPKEDSLLSTGDKIAGPAQWRRKMILTKGATVKTSFRQQTTYESKSGGGGGGGGATVPPPSPASYIYINVNQRCPSFKGVPNNVPNGQ